MSRAEHVARMGRLEKCREIWFESLNGREYIFGRPGCRRENNNKTDLPAAGWLGVGLGYLAGDKEPVKDL